MSNKRDSIRIMHVFGAMNRGGAELRTLDVVRVLQHAPFHHDFCTLSGEPGVLEAEIRGLGGRVFPLPLGVGFPRTFARLLQDQHVDVVHSHVYLFSGALLALAAGVGVRRRIAHFRATAPEQPGGWTRPLYELTMRKLINHFATDILACGTAAMTEGWTREWTKDGRCRVIHNGVDVQRFAPFDTAAIRATVRHELQVPPEGLMLLQVGRFATVKHQQRAVSILAELPEAYLVFAGRRDGPEAATTRQLVEDAGLSTRVHFLGDRDDVPRLLSGADVLLLTSLSEGLPGALLEAIAAGTPFVASDVPGAREILHALPDTGLIVPLAASDAVWAHSVRELSSKRNHPEWRARARQQLAESVFSLDRAAAGHADTWLKAHHHRPPFTGASSG